MWRAFGRNRATSKGPAQRRSAPSSRRPPAPAVSETLRLHAVRGRMLVDGLDAASAAFEVGYESASQFNREYSRLCGQPPMRDIRTLRSPGTLSLESVSNRQSDRLANTRIVG